MSDGALICAVRQGRQEAYTALVERHQAHIYRLCYRICGNDADAEALAHDSFVEGYLKLEQLRDPERFGPWMRSLALNLCRMWYRENRRREALPLEEPINHAADEDADYAAIYLGLSRLSAPHRLTLVLHYWENLSYEEIARFLDVPIGTVMSRLHRARHALKQLMEQQTGEEEAIMPPDDDFKREVEAEIRVLLGMFAENPDAMERLSIILRRSPERLTELIRNAADEQALDDLARLLRRLGGTGIETALAGYFSGGARLHANSAVMLGRFVARGRPGSDGAPPTRIAWRGIYLLLDRLIASPADPAARVELLADLMIEASKEERAALLCVNTLLCWADTALPLLLDRFWHAATPEDLFRPADTLHALCRTGTRFAAPLIAPLREGDARRRMLALAGSEALARALHCDWLDLETAPDEQVALDARFRRKWATPLRKDRDPEVLRALTEAVAASLGDAGVDTRNRAVRTLGLLRARAYQEPILAAARHADPTTRMAALRALSDVADRCATDLLVETTRSGDPAERRLAVEALGRLQTTEHLPMIAGMLADPDREVRRAAIYALRGFDGEEALAVLRKALQSQDAAVRDAAAHALFAVKQRRATRVEPSGFHMADVVREGARPPLHISLEAAMRNLPEIRPYDEKEITRLIGQVCYDFSSTRRYLVEEGLLRRESGVYEMTATGEAVWRVERFIRGRYMA